MCLDRIPARYTYLPGSDQLLTTTVDFPQVDALVVLDCGDIRRAGLPEWAERYAIINIDHHASNAGTLGTAWVDSTFAAVGQQVFRLAQQAAWKITPEIATCLYTSIATDTGFFRHSNTTPQLLRDAAALMDLGADTRMVVENAAERKTLGELCLVKCALESLSQEFDGQVTLVEVPLSSFAACASEPEDAEGLVEYARAVPGTLVAVLLREVSLGSTKVSLRARGNADVSAVAVSFGGGGHRLAAGYTMNAPLAEAKTAVLERLVEVLPHA